MSAEDEKGNQDPGEGETGTCRIRLGVCSRDSREDPLLLVPPLTCTRWAPPRQEAAAPALPPHDPPVLEPNTNPLGLRLVPQVPTSTPGPVSCGAKGQMQWKRLDRGAGRKSISLPDL